MKIIQSPVTPPPSANGLSSEVAALAMWLLQKDPADRPSVKMMLNERFIRRQLLQSKFEFPQELLQHNITDRLTNGINPSAPHDSSMELSHTNTEGGAIARQQQQQPQPRAASSGSNAVVSKAPIQRGNRVRGKPAAERILSDKVSP
jgi:serine/threonine protein kinase